MPTLRRLDCLEVSQLRLKFDFAKDKACHASIDVMDCRKHVKFIATLLYEDFSLHSSKIPPKQEVARLT